MTADAIFVSRISGTESVLTDVPNTISTETGTGQGVQLEAILAYAVTNSLSVGAGGRFAHRSALGMKTRDGGLKSAVPLSF